ncbi:hypothetical protein KCU77_g18847, partial [Aureobasidium melanogenum]
MQGICCRSYRERDYLPYTKSEDGLKVATSVIRNCQSQSTTSCSDVGGMKNDRENTYTIQLSLIIQVPHIDNFIRYLITKDFAARSTHVVVACCQNHHICCDEITVRETYTFSFESSYAFSTAHDFDLTGSDEFATSHIDVIATSFGHVLPEQARAIVAEIDFEACFFQPV